MRIDKKKYREISNNFLVMDVGSWTIFLIYNLTYGIIPLKWLIVLLTLIVGEVLWWYVGSLQSMLSDEYQIFNNVKYFSRVEYPYLTLGYLTLRVFFKSTDAVIILFIPYIIIHTINLSSIPLIAIVDEEEDTYDVRPYRIDSKRLLSGKYLASPFTRSPIKYVPPLDFHILNFGLLIFYGIAFFTPLIDYSIKYSDIAIILMILTGFFFNLYRQSSIVAKVEAIENERKRSIEVL